MRSSSGSPRSPDDRAGSGVAGGIIGGIVAGVVFFAIGFIGPVIYMPESNQGPLVGIFFTGPAGFAMGAVLGVLVGRSKGAIGMAAAAGATVLLAILATAALGFVAQGSKKPLHAATLASCFVLCTVVFGGVALAARLLLPRVARFWRSLPEK